MQNCYNTPEVKLTLFRLRSISTSLKQQDPSFSKNQSALTTVSAAFMIETIPENSDSNHSAVLFCFCFALSFTSF